MVIVPNSPIVNNLINFFPLTDHQILERWTVDELDMLHDISGMGRQWRDSEHRAVLKKMEVDEIEMLDRIINTSLAVKKEGPKPVKKASGWVALTEENILTYDLPGRTGVGKAQLLTMMDQGHRDSRIFYVRIED